MNLFSATCASLKISRSIVSVALVVYLDFNAMVLRFGSVTLSALVCKTTQSIHETANALMGTLKLHLIQRYWAEPQPVQAPPCCTKCNFILFDVALHRLCFSHPAEPFVPHRPICHTLTEK